MTLKQNDHLNTHQPQPSHSSAKRHSASVGANPGKRGSQARDPRGTLLRITRYLLPFKPYLIGVALLVLLDTLMELLAPWMFGLAIDRFIANKDAGGLARLGLVLLAVYATAWLAQLSQRYAMVTVTQRIMRELRQRLYAHLQRLSLSFYDHHGIGELMSRFTNDLGTMESILETGLTELVSNGLLLIGILIMMFALNFWLALGTSLIVPVMALLTWRLTQRTRRGFREVQTNLGSLNSFSEEQIAGARVVQTFGRQQRAVAEFHQRNAAVREAATRAQSLAMVLPPLLMVLGNADIAIVTGLGGWLALRGAATIGTIATFVLYARRFFRPLRSLAELYNTMQSALAGAERVFETLDLVPELSDAPDAIAIASIEGYLTFDRVSFAYRPEEPVLHEISFQTQPGEMIALVGPTGAGKTTLVNLLAHLYEIDEGAIRIDGQGLREVTQDSLRRQLGIVLQDTYLFSDTVLENIRFGRPKATDEECYLAAQLAQAEPFILRLPQGYHTPLAEDGANLSLGQRQLLSIARTALCDPRILVLDEATSSVDTRTEAQVQAALLRLLKGRTALVIAHRLSTIRSADQVLVMEHGRIVERGTHDTLIEQHGAYYRLYASQFADHEDEMVPLPEIFAPRQRVTSKAEPAVDVSAEWTLPEASPPVPIADPELSQPEPESGLTDDVSAEWTLPEAKQPTPAPRPEPDDSTDDQAPPRNDDEQPGAAERPAPHSPSAPRDTRAALPCDEEMDAEEALAETVAEKVAVEETKPEKVMEQEADAHTAPDIVTIEHKLEAGDAVGANRHSPAPDDASPWNEDEPELSQPDQAEPDVSADAPPWDEGEDEPEEETDPHT